LETENKYFPYFIPEALQALEMLSKEQAARRTSAELPSRDVKRMFKRASFPGVVNVSGLTFRLLKTEN